MIRMRPCHAATLLAAAAALSAGLPAPLVAQECGLMQGTGLAATAGEVSYEQLRDVSGPQYGVDGSASLATLSVQAGYRRAALGRTDADIGRLVVTLPVPAHVLPLPLGPLSVCGSGHVGAARLPVGGDAATVVAGGAGLRIAVTLPIGAVMAVPYAEARGLAARSTGRLFGTDVGATGLSLGAEGGLRATLGRVTLHVTASLDGFDEGLGITPYPSTAAEVGLGIRF